MDIEKNMNMNMNIERVYIPYLINHRKITQDGGIKKIKQKICKTFAKLDKYGAMYLGIVKKIDIVVKKSATANTNINKISAFITFIPASSKGAMNRIQEIKKESGLKLPYSKDEKYWIILQQRKHQQSQQSHQHHTINCSNCNQTQRVIMNANTNKKSIENEDITDLFENLSCNDSGPSRKRMRF
jgi:hypothetical protein